MSNPNPWDALAGSATRSPRALETREKTQTRKVWTPVQLLPDPEPRDGFVFKWIRAGVRNDPDHSNYQKARREGWEPVQAEDHPELVHSISPDAKLGGIIEVGNLILCKMPEEMVLARRWYYSERNYAQLDAAENQYMSDDGHPDEMGKFSKVTGNARRMFGEAAGLQRRHR